MLTNDRARMWSRHVAYICDQITTKTGAVADVKTIAGTLLPEQNEGTINYIARDAESVYNQFVDDGKSVPSISYVEAIEHDIESWSKSQTREWEREEAA